MEAIRPSSDLRNKYQELAALTRSTGEPIFITVNGREDTVLKVAREFLWLSWHRKRQYTIAI